MPTHINRRAKVFVVNALLDLPGDDAEWLAEIRTQITMMGRLINQFDPEMITKLVDYFESHATPLRQMKIKQKLTTI